MLILQQQDLQSFEDLLVVLVAVDLLRMLQLVQKRLFDLTEFLGFVDELLDIFVLFVIIEVFIDDLIAVSLSVILYLCYAGLSLVFDRDQVVLHLVQTCLFLDYSTL